MTDEVAGGAAAPADSAPVADAEVVHTPNPISTESAAPSLDDALDQAFAKAEADAAKGAPAPVKSEAKPEPKVEAKPEAKTGTKEVKRDETGKFASDKPVESEKPVEATAEKPAAEATPPVKSTSAAPARFSPDAKAVWDTAPDPVKAEVARMERELTAGIEKHRASAEAFEPVRRFDEMAKQGGTTLDKALTAYTNMENLLRQDFPKGMQAICDNYGISLRDFAAKILGQTPEETASQSDATIRELKQELASLKEQVGGVTQTFQQQRETATHQEVTKFAEANPRFEELSDDIAFFLKSGRTKDLSEAYRLAERLNPAPVQAAAEVPASTAAIDLVAQTQKGSKSINGAPSNGSTRPARKPSKSLDDDIDAAFAAVG